MTPLEIEREGSALIAEDLAEHWENSARKLREEYTTRFFGIGKKYTTPQADRVARDIEAAAHGLRTVAKLIRDGFAPSAFRKFHK